MLPAMVREKRNVCHSSQCFWGRKSQHRLAEKGRQAKWSEVKAFEKLSCLFCRNPTWTSRTNRLTSKPKSNIIYQKVFFIALKVGSEKLTRNKNEDRRSFALLDIFQNAFIVLLHSDEVFPHEQQVKEERKFIDVSELYTCKFVSNNT